MNDISNYLNQVRGDWEDSRDAFPTNTFPPSQWPIPFFGNPATALVATVGVNPSSGEFDEARDWASVHSGTDWKLRLRDYFKLKIPAHEWFEPWRIGLELLGASYEAAGLGRWKLFAPLPPARRGQSMGRGHGPGVAHAKRIRLSCPERGV